MEILFQPFCVIAHNISEFFLVALHMNHAFVQQVKKEKKRKKKTEHPYLFQYKLAYIRNETGVNNHGLLSNSV